MEKNQELFCCAVQCPYYKDCEKGKKIEEVENDNIYFTIFGRFLRVHGRVLSIPLGRTVPIEYCPMCGRRLEE